MWVLIWGSVPDYIRYVPIRPPASSIWSISKMVGSWKFPLKPWTALGPCYPFLSFSKSRGTVSELYFKLLESVGCQDLHVVWIQNVADRIDYPPSSIDSISKIIGNCEFHFKSVTCLLVIIFHSECTQTQSTTSRIKLSFLGSCLRCKSH